VAAAPQNVFEAHSGVDASVSIGTKSGGTSPGSPLEPLDDVLLVDEVPSLKVLDSPLHATSATPSADSADHATPVLFTTNLVRMEIVSLAER